jgi:hypothetical protein
MRGAFERWPRAVAINQPRRRLILDTGATLHSMAGSYGQLFRDQVLLHSSRTARTFTSCCTTPRRLQPLAWMEANHLGQIRTGAASGYATDLLANPGSRNPGRNRLGISGSNAGGSDSRRPAH